MAKIFDLIHAMAHYKEDGEYDLNSFREKIVNKVVQDANKRTVDVSRIKFIRRQIESFEYQLEHIGALHNQDEEVVEKFEIMIEDLVGELEIILAGGVGEKDARKTNDKIGSSEWEQRTVALFSRVVSESRLVPQGIRKGDIADAFSMLTNYSGKAIQNRIGLSSSEWTQIELDSHKRKLKEKISQMLRKVDTLEIS
jgi:hypothetical protein